MFNEFDEVQEYLAGRKVTKYCLDEYIFKIARYLKEEGKSAHYAKDFVANWLNEFGYKFANYNLTIMNAYDKRGKMKRKCSFSVEILRNAPACAIMTQNHTAGLSPPLFCPAALGIYSNK